MTVELYKKYRPRKFSSMIGQKTAVRQLQEMLTSNSVPHSLMMIGPSGSGKTTAARILRKELGCGDLDYKEINAAKERGIDTVRDVDRQMRHLPLSGPCRVFVWDEVHQLTQRRGGDAQTALLKMLEDTPKHVYFILCTTHPEHLLPTIRTRCTPIAFKSVDPADIKRLLTAVLVREKLQYSEDVLQAIAECADGSPRMALVLAHQVMGLTEEERLECIQKADKKKQAFELVQALLWKRKKWREVAAILVNLDSKEELESLRFMILNCAYTELVKGESSAPRAHAIISAFQYPFFDSGKAGFAAACYDIAVIQK